MTARRPVRNDGTRVIAAVLEESGLHVDPGRFLATLRRTLRDLAGPTVAASPASQLTDDEIAELRAAGLEADQPLAAHDRAIADSAARLTTVLAEALDVATAATKLGVHESRVRQMLGDGSLFGVKDGPEWRIPTFQFAGDRLVRNLSPVLRAAPDDLHPLEVWGWLTEPKPDLAVEGRPATPIEWLESGGDPDRAAALAADL